MRSIDVVSTHWQSQRGVVGLLGRTYLVGLPLVVLFALIMPGTHAPAQVTCEDGDVNGDGIITGEDIALIVDRLLGLESAGWDSACDVVVDAALLIRALRNIETPDVEEITIMLPEDVPLVMVVIPAGSFVMGSPPGERGRWSDEGPQTNVTLTQDYYMGRYPVTQAQWLAVMGSWPGTAPSSTFGAGPSHPAYYVSWNDAQDFITALNAHISSSGQGPATMRLPTEAEWEYAARAGTTTRFYFGDSLGCDDVEEDCAAGTLPGNRSDYMWWWGNSGGQTQPVGQKLPNAFGLYDMHGNVWEWCQDWWSGSLPGGSVTDPTGPSSGSHRVLRGGSWNYFARNCRSASRNHDTPSFRFNNIGFRLASVR